METNANPGVAGEQNTVTSSSGMASGASSGAGARQQQPGSRDAGMPSQQQGAKAQARNVIVEAKDRAQDRVRSAITQTKSSAATTIGGLAQSLLLSSQTLNDQQNGAARYVEQAAERLERASQYLETADINDVMRRTEDWARKNPPLFIGGALALGILGARFLKSSAPSADQFADSASGGSMQFSDREVSTPLTEEP